MIRIALAQSNPTLGDIKANGDKFLFQVKQAKLKKADIIVFPELYLSGYPIEDLIYYEGFLDDCASELKRIAAKTKGIIAIVGFPSTTNGKMHNSAAVISNGEVLAIQDKSMLPNYGVFDEKRYFEPASDHYLFEAFRGNKLASRFGVTICEDIWVDKGPHKAYAKAGADLMINLSSSPYNSGKWDLRRALLEKRSEEDGVFITYTNLVGGQDELVFDGRSMAVSPTGDLIALGGAFTEDLVIVDLPVKPKGSVAAKSAVKVKGSKKSDIGTITNTSNNHLSTVRLELSRPVNADKNTALITSDTRSSLQQKIARPDKTDKTDKNYNAPDRISYYADIDRNDLNALVLGLRDYFMKNGFKKALIGLSGGIDSALTTAVAVRALGADNVYGLLMPSEFSSKGSITDAKKLAKNLGIDHKTIRINKLFDAYLSELKRDFKGLSSDVTEQNLQARIRGDLLMAYANKFGYLVLATGNKSELAVGYSTLYGDMVGGFAVIKDLFKGRVYDLSRQINTDAGYDLIPTATLNKAPSAELKPDQKDEDDLPPYPILDEVLRLHIEENRSFSEIEAAGFDHTIVHRIIILVNSAEYKRRQGPIGVKISPRAFGRDRRMPITNRYHFK